MQERKKPFTRLLILLAVAVAAIALVVLAGCYIIQSDAASTAQQQATPASLALGKETVAFSGKTASNSGWLKAVFSPDDIYQVKFYHGDHYNNLIVSSKKWARKVDADGNKPIIQKIPEYIASEGYDKITITPISGDGVYASADFSLLSSLDADQYPDDNILDFEINQYEIEIDEDDYRKIEQKRADALDLGILVTEDTDEVSAKIKADGVKYKASLRLKGDWTDHLTGDQWSFRIDLSGDYCIYGIQKFSLQPISTRIGIWEYLIYEMYREQGGVALRYNYADVFVNGVYKGVYAVEEFMTKRVIENSRKREGPIIRISEDFLWDHWAYYLGDEIYDDVSDESAGVFSAKKTITSSTLSGYASYAITQLNKLRRGEVPTEQVFDVDLYARLQAILDIFTSEHGRIWHNMRNYYNPVTALLEPIPFDELAFSNTDSVLIDKLSYSDYFGFSQCDEFKDLYRQYLLQLTADYPNFIARHQEKIDQIVTTLQRYSDTYSTNVFKVNDRIQELQGMFDVTEPTFELSYNYDNEAYALNVTNDNLLALYVTDIQNGNGESLSDLFTALKDEGACIIPGHSTVTKALPEGFDASRLANVKFVYHTAFSEDMTTSLANGNVKLGFYVVGYACGVPSGGDDGLAEPVQTYLQKMASNQLIQFGVFTGDIVQDKAEQEYADFAGALDATGKEWYVAPGNCDVLKPNWYAGYIGRYYGYFVKEKNLFIHLNCTENWGISDEELAMMQTAISQNPGVENIFVFTHPLNWWDPDNAAFTGFVANSASGYSAANKPNFYTDVLPLFDSATQNVYFIAGDTGAFANGCEIYYRNDGRYTYIASGVSGGQKDAVLEFYILEDGQVNIKLVALGGETEDALGAIADYTWKGAQ